MQVWMLAPMFGSSLVLKTACKGHQMKNVQTIMDITEAERNDVQGKTDRCNRLKSTASINVETSSHIQHYERERTIEIKPLEISTTHQPEYNLGCLRRNIESTPNEVSRR